MQYPRITPIVMATLLSAHVAAVAAAPVVQVYKSQYCDCCSDWIKHLEANGFTVAAQNVANPSDYRDKYGIPNALGSCHTEVVLGYAIEGHVPAADIKRLLTEKRPGRGLTVPAMPMGSPGMDGPHKGPYDVFLIATDGRYSTYHHYNGN